MVSNDMTLGGPGMWYFVIGGILFLVGCFVCWFFSSNARKNKVIDLKLKDNQKKVYDILVKQDGIGYFTTISREYKISKKELERNVKELKAKGILKEKIFSHQRKLYLKDYLNLEEQSVIEFIKKNKGEADFSLIIKKLKIDDNTLIPIGKKLVRLGLIVKIGRGYKTFFVLKEKLMNG